MSKNDLRSNNRTETIPEFQRNPKEKCKRKIGCQRKRKARIKRTNSKKKQEKCGMKSQLKTRYFLTIILFSHIISDNKVGNTKNQTPHKQVLMSKNQFKEKDVE